MSKQRKMGSWLGKCLLIIGLLMTICAGMLLHSVPKENQFLLPCSMLSEETQALFLEAARMIQKQDDQELEAMVLGRTQDMSFVTVNNQAQATIYAVPMSYFDHRQEVLISGRYIAKNDIQNAQRIIMLDEKTSFFLFPGGDAMGKAVLLNGEEWTVVGIFREKARFGEVNESVAYVPLSAAIQAGIMNQTMEIVWPDDSSGTQRVLMKDALSSWRPDGAFYQLSKEKAGAWMPLRWGAVIVGYCIIRFLLHLLILTAKKQHAIYKEKLSKQYAKQILPWMAVRILWLALYILLILAVAYVIIWLVTQAALTFPDWVPEKPVSITSYISRFWTLHGQASRSTQIISREISVISLGAWLVRWGCIAMYAGIIVNMLSKRIAEMKTNH